MFKKIIISLPQLQPLEYLLLQVYLEKKTPFLMINEICPQSL